MKYTRVRNKLLFLLFTFLSLSCSVTKKNKDLHTRVPFEKITVTSSSALFSRDTKDPSRFCLHYTGNVFVTLADGTTIESESLKIFLHTSVARTSAVHTSSKKTSDEKNIEKIFFSSRAGQGKPGSHVSRVRVNRENRKLQADTLEIVVAKKLCLLEGNVKVEQIKKSKQDIPGVTRCHRAKFWWDRDEIEFAGSSEKPVETTIIFDRKFRSFKKHTSVPKIKTREKTT